MFFSSRNCMRGPSAVQPWPAGSRLGSVPRRLLDRRADAQWGPRRRIARGEAVGRVLADSIHPGLGGDPRVDDMFGVDGYGRYSDHADPPERVHGEWAATLERASGRKGVHDRPLDTTERRIP